MSWQGTRIDRELYERIEAVVAERNKRNPYDPPITVRQWLETLARKELAWKGGK
jgi:hypothetical protein